MEDLRVNTADTLSEDTSSPENAVWTVAAIVSEHSTHYGIK